MKILISITLIILLGTSFNLVPTKDKILSLTAQIDKRSSDTLFVTVTLTNNSPDTVRYITWDCTWRKVYKTNSDKWTILSSDYTCFKNGHIEIKIPPFKSETKELELIKTSGIVKSKSSNFKIGFNFMTNISLKKIPSDFTIPKREQVVIWSNDVSPNYFYGRK